MNNYPEGDGIAIIKPKHGSTVHAFVEFADVDYAIQMLDGVKFDGKTLRVSKEKTFDSRKQGGGGFGSSRWAGSNFDGPKSEGRPKQRISNGGSVAASKLKTEREVVEEVKRVVSEEISDSSDKITSAIACTAAVSLLSSVDAFGLENNGNMQSGKSLSHLIPSINNEKGMSDEDFQSRCQLPMSDLLGEYGEQDLDWKSHKPTSLANSSTNANNMTNDDFRSRCKLPMTELLAEYGEQDSDWKKQQQHSAPVDNNRNQGENNENKNYDNGMLAPFEKAFIHLELVSFGFKYGAPSHSKKGFTYAHPLPPIDARDLERAPAHVAKFNGLSYLVKKALLNPSDQIDETQKREKDATQSPMRRKANEIADDIIKVLVESINEGGHGPISPLTMTISIGSEYGRHRSVVIVEHLAVILRARLRRNDGKGYCTGELDLVQNGIVRQLVSVETRHRDIDARHRDEEAFGEDLKREVRAAEKAKRRQEREDEYW